HEIFDTRLIKLNLESSGKDAAFFELIDTIADVYPDIDREKMDNVIQEREKKLNTFVASGTAIPHGYYPGLDRTVGAIGISKTGIDYDAAEPVYVIFMIIMGNSSQENHLSVLSRILSLIESGALDRMAAAQSVREVHDLLSRFN
ncbi:MAG: PTS sugar transporter subunit IIA, partial [Treponema sp.]|nr:PTS sugar transporter subunit IIA [Treponema sp.]